MMGMDMDSDATLLVRHGALDPSPQRNVRTDWSGPLAPHSILFDYMYDFEGNWADVLTLTSRVVVTSIHHLTSGPRVGLASTDSD